MSSFEPTRLPSGIRARHRAGCPAHHGNACQCSPAYEASIFSKRDAKKIRKTFDKLADAKRWLNEQRKQRDDGSLQAPARITLNDAAAKFLALAESGGILNRSGDAYKPSAVRSYRTSLDKHVLPHIGHTRLNEITRGQLQRLVARWQEAGQAASTIGNTVNALRAIYSNADLLSSGSIGVNPTRDLRLPARRGKRERIASVDEATLLLAALPETERALWATAFYAGLRRGELRALDWSNVNLAGGTITVASGWDDHEGEINPKSRAGIRTVPIIGRLREALTEHRILTRRTSGLVFGADGTKPFTTSTVGNRAKRSWKAAKLAPIGLHEARHTFASYLLDAGVDFKKISTYMGHASVAFTMDRYAKLMPNNQADTVALIDAYMERADTGSRIAAIAA